MIDLKKLIDFLPFEYKDQDTYKVDGKGILERFLEICGSYFQDNISADIETLLGITDFDTCPEIYLNYLWESFGQLPFARWDDVDEITFKTYYNGLLSEAELTNLESRWVLPKKKRALTLSTKQIRDLLKYSLSLLKIRGTSQFFEILFKMYGLTCTIDDPAKSRYDGWLKSHPYFDQDQYYDKAKFDNIYGCSQCINVTFHIGGHNYSDISPEFIEFRKAIENIIDRFKPYHVGAKIDYGFELEDNYRIVAEFVDPNITLIQPGYINSVPIRVKVTSDYSNADLRYQVSGDGNTWGYRKYESGAIFNATVGDQTYYFRSVGDPTKIVPIHVALNKVVTSYNISVSPTTLHITPDNKEVSATVTAILYQEGKQTPVNIRQVGETEIKPSGTVYKFKEAGIYEFQIVEYPVKRVSLVVTKEPNRYRVKCNPESIQFTNQSMGSGKTVLTIEDDYGEKGLQCYLVNGDGTLYNNGDTFSTFSTGIYKFRCTKDTSEGEEGVGIFIASYINISLQYSITGPNSTLIMSQDKVVAELNLYVSPKDTQEKINQTIEIYSGGPSSDTKIDTIVASTEVYDSVRKRFKVDYEISKAGTYTAKCQADLNQSVTWTVINQSEPSEPFIFIEATNTNDPGWISPTDWGNISDSEKKQAIYQLKEGSQVKFTIQPKDITSTDIVVCKETGKEYKFKEVITLDLAGTYTFIPKGDTTTEPAVLTIRDYALEVNISCNPTKATLSGQGTGEVHTTVVCSSNHKDFITDVRLVGQADSHPVPYDFKTSNPGTYIFESVNKPEVRCTFEVTLAFDVQPNELVWNSNDISSKTFEINIPENTAWRITQKNQE